MKLALRRIGRRKLPDGLQLASSTKKSLFSLERLLRSKDPIRKVVLLSGQAGMGKTASLAAMARSGGRSVYRVDCSKLFSKYIGETEKNLSAVFGRAEQKGLVLFFDEADALFGKRTGVRGAHQGYANQEVSYLLKRVRAYDGLVVFLSRDVASLKQSFLRYVDHVVEFKKGRARRGV